MAIADGLEAFSSSPVGWVDTGNPTKYYYKYLIFINLKKQCQLLGSLI
jgi:hypothetical protein